MLKRTIRYALLAVLALALAGAVTLTVSPAARAAVQAIFSFNGVDVSIDDNTGKLVTSGNTGAIIKQTDHEVVIRGKNGEIAGIVTAKSDVKMVDVTDLLSQYPDVVLPTAPAGYTRQPQGQLFDDGSLMITWTDAAGHTITYQRTKPIMESFGVAVHAAPGADSGPGGVITNTVVGGGIPDSGPGVIITSTTGESSISESGVPVEDSSVTVSGGSQVISGTALLSGSQTTVSGGQPSPLTTYTWEAGGYFYILTATDSSLTQADLKAMLP